MDPAKATITCPECGATAEEAMPADACLFFYECRGCRQILRPKAGDCCVFCSYSDKKCPPKASADCCRPRSVGAGSSRTGDVAARAEALLDGFGKRR